jgi:hypothetical protein
MKNTVASKEDKLKLHAQPTTLAPSQHIPSPPPSPELTLSYMPLHHLLATNPKPTTIWKQPCLWQGTKDMTSHKEISQRPKSMKYHQEIS